MLVKSENRKFKDQEYYGRPNDSYYLLPFQFIDLNESKEVIVNTVGDFLIVEKGTAERIVNRDLKKEDELFKDLLANFFISTTQVPQIIDVLATRYRTKKSFLDSFTSLHIFVVTLRCNHSCHYCQVSRVTENVTEYDISFEDLLQGINHMMQSPSECITMEFQGGEPLLAFGKIKFAVETALELNKHFKKRITLVICTNGTIISQEIIDFCREHRVLISTSLDGPEFIHNPNRKINGNNSFQRVIKGISQFRAELGHDQVSALMTTSTLSLDYPIEIINCYLEHGFRNIFLRGISPYGFALKSIKKNKYETERFLEFYRKGLEYILDLNIAGTFFVEDYTSILLKKILTPFPTTYVDLQSPAGAISSVVVFNYDGSVYCSDEARMLAENGDFTFLLGHVNQSYMSLFNSDKAKTILGNGVNESLAGCSECAFQPYCGADPVHHHATQGNMEGFRPTSSFCQRNMSVIKIIFELIDSRREALSIFYSWIRNSNLN